MKSAVLRVVLAVAFAAGVSAAVVHAAEEGIKALPTLLIKGEVVSLDTNDPSANLLTVKDRYGFETPIYLTQETKITQGDAVIETSTLAAGTSVEVEYNFDVNTAKRHAVSVKLAAVPAPAAPAEAAVTPAAAPSEATSAAPSMTESAQPAKATLQAMPGTSSTAVTPTPSGEAVPAVQ